MVDPIHLDAPRDGAVGIVIEQHAEMGILAAGAAEIVPGLEREGAIRLGPIGERGAKIGERGPVRVEQRADAARERRAQIARALRPERAGKREDAADEADHAGLGDAGSAGALIGCTLLSGRKRKRLRVFSRRNP